MKFKFVLLAGILTSGLLILATPTLAAPGSELVVAQNCPPPKKMIKGQCVLPPPPPAARPAPPPPPAARPAPPPPAARPAPPPPPPAAAKPTSPPPPAAARPVQREQFRRPPAGQPPAAPQQPAQQAPPPAQKQIRPLQTQPATRPQGQPPIQQVTPQIAPAPAATPANVRKLDDFRGQRHESRQGNSVIFQEPGRTIIRDSGHLVIQRNESSDRFRLNARNVQTERQGANIATTIDRPNGAQIVNLTDSNGRLLRRSRRDASGRDVVLIDNTRHHGSVAGAAAIGAAAAVAGLVILNMAEPVIRIPRDRYIVEADGAGPALIYETLMAPPVDVLDRDYSLDEIRYNVALRDRMPRIDIDTVTFATGSWEVTPDQAQRLQFIADGIKRAIEQNPDEVFMIEGHTDAVGSDVDNLSLSDRRAESVAEVLTEQFGIPPENLTTQGYGAQYLKIPTLEPERRNRRVTIRRITPLLNGPVAQNR
jgi:outer membrane protein OmpA-like peptidoglycan-associated protein